MLDSENEHTAWTAPRLLGNKNLSVMKPLIFPDGTIMRSMDDFKLVGKPDKVRIRFLKEDVNGKPIFVSEFPVDNDAVFAEQMPIIRNVQTREKYGKNKYYYIDDNGRQREIENHRGARTRMTAYLSDNDGKTFPHKLLLCDDGKISYPSATLGKDGAIYIVYDQGRGVIGQHTIFLSKISEEDIVAGKLLKTESFLNNIVSRPSDQGGGRREGDKL